MQVVPVGPFHVADCDQQTLIERVTADPQRKRTVFALHVGGLNARAKGAFVEAMNRATYVYADGAAVVTLARIAGAKSIERSATTDIGVNLIKAEGRRLGRPARIAIVGGSDGLAERAGGALELEGAGDVVLTAHGYQHSYEAVLEDLRKLAPDVVIVGMGMPREAMWVQDHIAELPNALIMTCGGWLGFLAGDEQRAPSWMQRAGLEWSFRLFQSPRRLWSRYANGVLTSAQIVPRQVAVRRTLSRVHP